MGGMLLTGVITGWIFLSLWAALRWAGSVQESCMPGTSRTGTAAGLKITCQAAALWVLLPLPLLDELVAQAQFASLCRDQVALRVMPSSPGPSSGALVRLRALPPEPLNGLAVPVSRHQHLYIDVETLDARASFNAFEAQAGKLARVTGAASAPLTFGGRCGPNGLQAQLAGAGLRLAAPTDTGMGSTSH